MLGWRILVSAVLIPSLAFIFYMDAHTGPAAWWLLILCEILAIRSVWELADLFRDRSKPLQLPEMFLCSAGVVFAAWIPHLPGEEVLEINLTAVAIFFAFAVMVLCATEAARFHTPGGNIETLGTEILIVAYCGVLLSVTAQLRWIAGSDAGYLCLGSLLVCTKGGDIGAFTLGKMFGRQKLAPALSPGKTREGALGAVLGAGLMGWLWLTFATPIFIPGAVPPAWYVSVVYGCILGIVGLIGDLVESLIKRDVGKKDSAALFPGFGGLLDILDSVIFAGPVALMLWKVLPLATWLSER
ncbi:MAG: phosphatidate cytidylyltransferase [Planctomycetaceae bacterium]|nr:phosphatidate cytidylyltransferase [Planctomycetaceae bacterium]